MRITSTIGLIAAIISIAACGGSSSSDLAGVYQITHHTINETGCDQEGPESTGYSHFQLSPEEFFGQDLLSFGECQSASPDTCSGLGLFSGYIEMGDEWVSEISSSSGGGSLACLLGFSLSTITETGVGELRIESRRHSDTDDALSEDQCSTDEASLRGSDMPCDRFEVIVGTLVE